MVIALKSYRASAEGRLRWFVAWLLHRLTLYFTVLSIPIVWRCSNERERRQASQKTLTGVVLINMECLICFSHYTSVGMFECSQDGHECHGNIWLCSDSFELLQNGCTTYIFNHKNIMYCGFSELNNGKWYNAVSELTIWLSRVERSTIRQPFSH